MIVDSIKPTIESTGFEDADYFSINQADLPHIFRVLRSSLYSNKVLAVIREYSTNAADAHVMAGTPDLPVEVTLPTSLEPIFKVRDFGPGLSDHDVRLVYTSYGASTKRDSNEFIGQLGLGSKSAFAYANSFSITSWHDRFKRVYEAFIDETDLGKIIPISSEESDEPNGVEISIAVNHQDIHRFDSESRTFFQFFSPRPKIVSHPRFHTYFESEDSKVPFMEGDNWKLYDGSRSFVVMGNVSYPIDNNQLEKCMPFSLNSCGVVFRAPIGTVHFTANREALEYNNTTRKFFEAVAKEIQEVATIEYKKKLESVTSLSKAKKLFRETNKLSSQIKQFLPKEILWDGEKIERGHINRKDLVSLIEAGIIVTVAKPGDRGGVKYVESFEIDSEDDSIILDSFKCSRKDAPYKVRTAVDEVNSRGRYNRSENERVILRYRTQDQLDLIKNHPELEDMKFVSLEDFDGKAPVYKSYATRIKSKVFEYSHSPVVPDGEVRKNGNLPRDNWISSEFDTDDESEPKPYFTICDFKPLWDKKLSSTTDEASVGREIRLIHNVFPDEEKTIFYGIRSSVSQEDIGPGWIKIEDWIRERLWIVLKDQNFREAMALCIELSKDKHNYYRTNKVPYFLENIRPDKLPDCKFTKALKYLRESKKNKVESACILYNELFVKEYRKPKLKLRMNIFEVFKEAYKDMPLLEHLNNYSYLPSEDDFEMYIKIMLRSKKYVNSERARRSAESGREQGVVSDSILESSSDD